MTGELAADWISAHPEALSTKHFFSVLQVGKQPHEASSNELPPEALLEQGRIDPARTQGPRATAGPRGNGRARLRSSPLPVHADPAEGDLAGQPRAVGWYPFSFAVRWMRYLADRGLVERTKSKTDRRVICLQLTPSGRAVLDKLSLFCEVRLVTVSNRTT